MATYNTDETKNLACLDIITANFTPSYVAFLNPLPEYNNACIDFIYFCFMDLTDKYDLDATVALLARKHSMETNIIVDWALSFNTRDKFNAMKNEKMECRCDRSIRVTDSMHSYSVGQPIPPDYIQSLWETFPRLLFGLLAELLRRFDPIRAARILVHNTNPSAIPEVGPVDP